MNGRSQETGARRQENSEDFTFTPEELEILRLSAEHTRRIVGNLGGSFDSYQETRYEFAKDWAEGNHWNSKKSVAWAERIKREVRALIKSAGSAGATTSGSACS